MLLEANGQPRGARASTRARACSRIWEVALPTARAYDVPGPDKGPASDDGRPRLSPFNAPFRPKSPVGFFFEFRADRGGGLQGAIFVPRDEKVLGIAQSTAEEDWTYSKAWLRRKWLRGEQKQAPE